VSEEITVVPTPPAEAPSVPGLQHPNMLRDIIETMILVAIAFLVINALIGRFRIEQVSMLPNLHEGEYVIVDGLLSQAGTWRNRRAQESSLGSPTSSSA
jgi:hypothetical protein